MKLSTCRICVMILSVDDFHGCQFAVGRFGSKDDSTALVCIGPEIRLLSVDLLSAIHSPSWIVSIKRLTNA